HCAVPVVGVNLWYHVGSRNEHPGRTGFAHLFEHLMFEGSAHVPPGRFDRLLEDAGGINNGSTTADRTNYWITVPAHALELALYLEADRMGWLPPAMTKDKLEAQRSVVMNERRQSYDNRPYGLASERLLAALYPPNHPYHWPTIGSMEDIRAATLDDVMAFFHMYYIPGNATLAVAGAVRSDTVRELVERYFGEIPCGSPPPKVWAPAARLEADRHEVLEDDVHLARLYMLWHSPAAFAPGDAELDMAAHVLTRGKMGRVYKTLIYERQIAQEVISYQRSGQLGSSFVVIVTARPGTSLRELEGHVRGEIEAIATHGISTEELERATNLTEAAFVDELQTVGGFGGRADRLNLYAFHTGDPGYLARDLARYASMRADAVRDATSAWLLQPCVVLDVVPKRSHQSIVDRRQDESPRRIPDE
ncbi:MAG: M16 family metallopeptidase, partial [Longimicrobiales bacterium]